MLKLIFKYAGILSLIWALVIFTLCAIPGQYIPSVSFLELLSFDKFVHAGMFYVLCLLIFIYLNTNSKHKTIYYLYLLSAIAYGCLLELMQGYVFSNRSADWQDMIANSFGCFIAFITFKQVISTIKRLI